MPSGHRAQPPDNTLRVAYSGYIGPCTWTVVHWMATDDLAGITLADLQSVADSLATHFGDDIVAHFCSNQTYLTLTKVQAFFAMSNELQTFSVVDVEGGGSGDPTPGQVCSLIDWICRDRRRGGKPRSYIPSPGDTMLASPGTLSPTVVTSLTGHANDYLAHVAAVSHGAVTVTGLVDMSFVDSLAYRAVAVYFPIEGARVRDVLATQRRRVDRLAGA